MSYEDFDAAVLVDPSSGPHSADETKSDDGHWESLDCGARTKGPSLPPPSRCARIGSHGSTSSATSGSGQPALAAGTVASQIEYLRQEAAKSGKKWTDVEWQINYLFAQSKGPSMLTVEDLHEAAEYVGADEDGARIGQAGIAKDDVIEFVMGSDFSYANGEPADVDPASLALGIAIGATAANGVPEV